MAIKDQNNFKKSRKRLVAAIFILLILIVSGFFIFSPISLEKFALALSGNYNKNTGDQLILNDWNTLDDDFLDKENPAGDAMAGPLTLPSDPTQPMQASTKQYVDSLAATVTFAADRNGAIYNSVVCDSYLPAWVDYEPAGHIGVSATIDTRSSGGIANFSSAPRYYVSIEGINLHYNTQGSLAIYFPSNIGFSIYLKTTLYAVDANINQWRINWCGYGN